jgi:hypothetical protein
LSTRYAYDASLTARYEAEGLLYGLFVSERAGAMAIPSIEALPGAGFML